MLKHVFRVMNDIRALSVGIYHLRAQCSNINKDQAKSMKVNSGKFVKIFELYKIAFLLLDLNSGG